MHEGEREEDEIEDVQPQAGDKRKREE